MTRSTVDTDGDGLPDVVDLAPEAAGSALDLGIPAGIPYTTIGGVHGLTADIPNPTCAATTGPDPDPDPDPDDECRDLAPPAALTLDEKVFADGISHPTVVEAPPPAGAEATCVPVTFVLGDSFTSGEGAGGYDPRTDTVTSPERGRRPSTNPLAGLENRCHRSPRSYPFVAGAELGHTVVSVACSGAKTSDVRFDRFCGPRCDRARFGEAPQLEQLERYLRAGYRLDRVVIGIGGNDTAFGPLLEACALPGYGCHTRVLQDLKDGELCVEWQLSPDQCRTSRVLDVIANTIDVVVADRIARVLSETRAVVGPDVELVVTGYPELFTDPRLDRQSCDNVRETVNVGTEETYLVVNSARRLNAAIAREAGSAGARYVALNPVYVEANRLLCNGPDQPSWLQPLTRGAVPSPLGRLRAQEAAHPTHDGHAASGRHLAACMLTDDAVCTEQQAPVSELITSSLAVTSRTGNVNIGGFAPRLDVAVCRPVGDPGGSCLPAQRANDDGERRTPLARGETRIALGVSNTARTAGGALYREVIVTRAR